MSQLLCLLWGVRHISGMLACYRSIQYHVQMICNCIIQTYMTDKHIPQYFPCMLVILPDSATEANILVDRSLKLPTQPPAGISHWGDLILNVAGVSPYIKTRPNLTLSYSQVYWLKKMYCLKLSHTCSVWIMTGVLPINLILWAVTVIGMHLPIIFKGYGDLRNKTNKHVCDYQGFAHSFLTALPI